MLLVVTVPGPGESRSLPGPIRAIPRAIPAPLHLAVAHSVVSPSVASWGSWPLEAHDSQRTAFNPQERTLAAANISELRRVWSVELPKPILATPIVVNGTVYIGDGDGYLYALRASNGSQVWRTRLGDSTSYLGCQGLGGIVDAAAFWNGTLYIGGANPRLYAINASNGSILWSVDLANHSSGNWRAHLSWASPLLYNGSAYVGVSSGCDNPLVVGQVLQINLSGSSPGIQRAFSATKPTEDGGGVWRAPSVDPATNTVYATTGNENDSCTCLGGQPYTRALLSLGASNLSLLGYWQNPDVGCDCDFGTSPIVAAMPGGPTYIEGMNKDGNAYVFESANLTKTGSGKPLWSDQVSTSVRGRAGGVFDGSSMYLAGGATTLANGSACPGSFNALPLSMIGAGAKFSWQYCAPGDVEAGLSMANGLLFGLAVNYPRWTQQWFQVLNATTGKLLFSTLLNQTVPGSAAIADGRVFLTTWNGSTLTGPGYVDAFGLPLNASIRSSPPGANGKVALRATATGGTPPYLCTWSFGDGATGSGCNVTHTYASNASFSLALNLTDSSGEIASAVGWENVSGITPLTLLAFSASPQRADAGLTVTLRSNLSGGSPPYSYSYAGLPPNCASENLSLLTCRPGTPGTWTVRLTAHDEGVGSVVRLATFTTVPDPTVAAASADPSSLPLGNNSTLSLQLLGGIPPFAFTYEGLPPGCASANASTLECGPTAVGNFTIQISATDVDGMTVSAMVLLTVLAPVPLVVTEIRLVPTQVPVGGTVRIELESSGGMPPYSYQFTGLPAGCSSQNAPAFDCIPAAPGSYGVTGTVMDSQGTQASNSAFLTVHATMSNPPSGLGSRPHQIPPLWEWTLGIAIAAVGIGLFLLVGRRRLDR